MYTPLCMRHAVFIFDSFEASVSYRWCIVPIRVGQGSKKRFFKKRNPVGFFWILLRFGFYWFFGQAGKIGKIIQKLSNLKP